MKGFFKHYSYSIVKNLLNQFAISVFGAFLSMATTAASNDKLSLAVSIFAIIFYLFLVYNTMWEIGAKDRVSFDVGKRPYRPHTGLIIGLVSNIPNFFIAFSFLFLKIPALPENFAGTADFLLRLFSMVFQGMYAGILMTVKVSADGMTLIKTWWAYFIIIIPALLISWLAYYTGFKNFRVFAQLFDKKNKSKKK